MISKTLTFNDFNDNEVTDTFWFHMTKPELVDMEVKYKDGFESFIKKIIRTTDRQELINLFKEIIVMAYGVKSDDGLRFIKSEELATEFTQTAAYESLYMEFITQENALAEFMVGIMPKDMQGEATQKIKDMPAEVLSAPSPPKPPAA